jgi:maltose 6'-phosphate phosphatase
MATILELLTVENTTNRKIRPTQQKFAILISVANLAHEKQVDVLWIGNDHVWRCLPATFLACRGEDQEYWQAYIEFKVRNRQTPLPGDIRFAVRLRCQNKEYWDNNQGKNHCSPLSSGLALVNQYAVQNLSFINRLSSGQRSVTIKIVTNSWFKADCVTIHWSTDNWQRIRKSNCILNKNSKNSATHLFTVRLRIDDAFRIEYAISCKNSAGEYWDNNCGINYKISREPLKVLVLNLHCYQENDQYIKFVKIAKAIDDLRADLVCFQEVAEHWNQGYGDWDSNSANIINSLLKEPFDLYCDWSHRGFDKFREGVAILSRYPLQNKQSAYVSDSDNVYDIHSRKVVAAQVSVPYFGLINIFSAHLSWWENGFNGQFQRLSAWAKSLIHLKIIATLLCGDFNTTPDAEGYKAVIDDDFEDQYLAANEPENLARIDFIFMHKSSQLQAISARIVFTENDYGQVSDHPGYLITFEPK